MVTIEMVRRVDEQAGDSVAMAYGMAWDELDDVPELDELTAELEAQATRDWLLTDTTTGE